MCVFMFVATVSHVLLFVLANYTSLHECKHTVFTKLCFISVQGEQFTSVL